MMSSMPSAGLIHLGMDTSMNTIVVGVLGPGEEIPVVDRIFHDKAQWCWGQARRCPVGEPVS